MHISKTLVLILSMSFLLCSCIKEAGGNESMINRININDHIPAFTVTDTAGNAFNSRQFLDKQSLLVFFGTYCPDCKKVLPVIEEVWKELKSDPSFLLVPISREETAEKISEYWKDNRFTMPFYIDPNAADPDLAVFYLFANSTIPRIYIINPDSKVTWMSIESLDLSAEELIRKIKESK